MLLLSFLWPPLQNFGAQIKQSRHLLGETGTQVGQAATSKKVCCRTRAKQPLESDNEMWYAWKELAIVSCGVLLIVISYWVILCIGHPRRHLTCSSVRMEGGRQKGWEEPPIKQGVRPVQTNFVLHGALSDQMNKSSVLSTFAVR